MAVARRGGDVAGCILHSDRGSQFRARKVHRALTRHRMVGSMGQVGSAGDNAAMESFFALLQKNVLDRRRWATRDELRIAIVTWIERTYHRRRRQAALGRLTPIEYEIDHDRTRPRGCGVQRANECARLPRARAADIPCSVGSSGGLVVVAPGGVFVVGGAGLEAAVEDADEAVAELA